MGINLQSAILYQDLCSIINHCGLPPCVIGLTLDKIRAGVTSAETRAIASEHEEIAHSDEAIKEQEESEDEE